MINKLGWIKKQFIEHNPDEIKEGYVFTIDGESLEYNSFQPLVRAVVLNVIQFVHL